MSNEHATTVDSLCTFRYKKKFSFAKKLVSDDLKVSDKSGSSESESSSALEDEDVNLKAASNWKGSAKLKDKDSTSSDDEKIKKKSDKRKKKHKHSSQHHMNDDDKLNKLYRMFPHHSTKLVEKIFHDNDKNAKRCVDALLKEKETCVVDAADKSLEIDEWSDGDETIRAKNKENKLKRLSNDSEGSEAATTKKRKSTEEVLKEPLKKKARKLIVDSSDEEAEVAETTKTKQKPSIEETSSSSSTPSSCTKTSTSSRSSGHAEMKTTNKKKLVIKSSSEEEDEEEEARTKKHKKESSKKHKHSKKDKKESKKSKNRRDDEEENDFDQDDDDFDRSGASGGSDDSDMEGDNMTDSQKAAILSLFNDASVEDIQSMISISIKRVKNLVELRPFLDFSDLRMRLSQKQLLPVIDSAKDIIYARSIVGNLLSKCQQISQKMQDQVTALIDSSNDSKSNTSVLELKTQPECLNKNLSLKPYQLIGLNWLCLMHKEKINGILADEMGLGKTCQTISFLAHLFEQNKKQMHLIIVPPSTLDNWIREISTWCPDFNFTVYQGNLEERRHLRFDVLNNKFEKPLNAILTTYGLISSTSEDKAFFKKLTICYTVFDEAHMLKNMNSIRYQALIKIKSKHKLLLTGTPLQNNLVELMSLLYFVMPDIFNNKTEYLNKIFAAKPANIDTDTFYNEKIAQAKGIMKPFILRRLKTEVLKQLPKKIEEIIYCDMTQRQNKEYNSLIEYYKARKDQIMVEAQEKAEKVAADKAKKLMKSDNNNAKNIEDIYEIINSNNKKVNEDKNKSKEDSSSNILMELRKAANHPLLRRSIFNDDKLKQMARLIMKESPPDTVFEYVLEDMSVMSDFQLHKLCFLYKCLKGFELSNQDVLDSAKFTILSSLLEEKKQNGDRVLIFSQFVIMLDIVEEYLKIKKYKYFRLDGTTAVSERQDMIDAYNHDNEIFIFLLSTKAGGVGINLTAANVVVMHDIDYNPFNDKQAEDRCHRVGQTKEVQVYKLISKNSIDVAMLKIQQKKLELGEDVSGVNDENESKVDMVSMLKEALKI